MPFIGILAKESESNFIKNEVLKNSKKTKFEFININKESIQNVKNIKFETLIINENLSEFLKTSKYIEKIMKNAKYIIIDTDIENNLNSLKVENKNIITYGLNQKAIVTISSIKQENVMVCLQKSIKNINGKLIEEQEFNIEINNNNQKKICNSLVIFTILTIYGEFLKKI